MPPCYATANTVSTTPTFMVLTSVRSVAAPSPISRRAVRSRNQNVLRVIETSAKEGSQQYPIRYSFPIAFRLGAPSMRGRYNIRPGAFSPSSLLRAQSIPPSVFASPFPCQIHQPVLQQVRGNKAFVRLPRGLYAASYNRVTEEQDTTTATATTAQTGAKKYAKTTGSKTWTPGTKTTMYKRKKAADSGDDETTARWPKRAPKEEPEDPEALVRPHKFAAVAEENGIVQRKYYPAEMSTERARAYTKDKIIRPMVALDRMRKYTLDKRVSIEVRGAVVHWFKMDLRTTDNRGLWEANKKARDAGVPLICMYLISPQDLEAHCVSPGRVDFMLRSLQVLKEDLAKLDIPLYIETVEKRKDIPNRIMDLMDNWGASHLYCNLEYEVDELRRETKLMKLCADRNIAMQPRHDTCVVPPNAFHPKRGPVYTVYGRWYKRWIGFIHQKPEETLTCYTRPTANPPETRDTYSDLFDCVIPEAPEGKRLSEADAKKFAALWPAGEHEAARRLAKFCEEKIYNYNARQNIPGSPATALISVHLAAGTLSARAAIRLAVEKNTAPQLDMGLEGIKSWTGEIAWRDYYKHILTFFPYLSMYKPFIPEFADIEWSYNKEHFQAWCDGKTGYPIVDAAMRQLKATGYMPNRCRLITASFLTKDLMIDWRLGERYFMENLIDGDFASNNGGWGYAASVGVDRMPFFRIFSPYIQSEKFDPDGSYIRKWVPEISDVVGDAIHHPWGRGASVMAEIGGYPRPIVRHIVGKDKVVAMWKEFYANNELPPDF